MHNGWTGTAHVALQEDPGPSQAGQEHTSHGCIALLLLPWVLGEHCKGVDSTLLLFYQNAGTSCCYRSRAVLTPHRAHADRMLLLVPSEQWNHALQGTQLSGEGDGLLYRC